MLSFCLILRRSHGPRLSSGSAAPRLIRRIRARDASPLAMSQGNGSTGAVTSSQEETVTFLPDGTLARRTKLGVVVKDAVRRWYLEAEKEAYRGDVKAQALLGQMLIEGYGCKADPEKGREWVEKARRRGYRMQGVYCVI